LPYLPGPTQNNGFLYGIPLSIFFVLTTISRSAKILIQSLPLAILAGLTLGLLYWTIVQQIFPLYHDGHARSELRFACYVGSTRGGGIAMAFLCKRMRAKSVSYD